MHQAVAVLLIFRVAGIEYLPLSVAIVKPLWRSSAWEDRIDADMSVPEGLGSENVWSCDRSCRVNSPSKLHKSIMLMMTQDSTFVPWTEPSTWRFEKVPADPPDSSYGIMGRRDLGGIVAHTVNSVRVSFEDWTSNQQ
jgi:hypothetical protein